uniref:protein PAXX isoform X2 n=1 Tax=Pristiophorus japonicus TaxID=55135 RepID=UPI00398F6973
MEAKQRLPSIGSLHIHSLPQSHQRYLCYTRPGPHNFNLCVTNVVDVWSTGFNPQKLEEHIYLIIDWVAAYGPKTEQSPECRSGFSKSAHGVQTSEEYHTRTREAFQKAAVSLTVLDNTIILKLSQDDLGLTFDLYKLPITEAKAEIQSVMFQLVGQIYDLQDQLKDYDSKKRWNGPGSSPVAKRRLAGESLINPGSKRTKAPTGVSFEDNSHEDSNE